jgi:hypothetical protein
MFLEMKERSLRQARVEEERRQRQLAEEQTRMQKQLQEDAALAKKLVCLIYLCVCLRV